MRMFINVNQDVYKIEYNLTTLKRRLGLTAVARQQGKDWKN